MKTVQAWIARDMDSSIWLYFNKPVKTHVLWRTGNSDDILRLNNPDFPNVKWEDEEPTEVEITIKVKQHEET